MSWNTEIDVEDVIGAVGVGLAAAGLYIVGLEWMLVFLGLVLMGLAVWMGITRPRQDSGRKG
jgi:hypothetical protein